VSLEEAHGLAAEREGIGRVLYDFVAHSSLELSLHKVDYFVCQIYVFVVIYSKQTVTTVTYSAPTTIRLMSHFRVPSVSSMKQKTLQFALERCSRTQSFQVSRQHGVQQQKALVIFNIVPFKQ